MVVSFNVARDACTVHAMLEAYVVLGFRKSVFDTPDFLLKECSTDWTGEPHAKARRVCAPCEPCRATIANRAEELRGAEIPVGCMIDEVVLLSG
jgi:hypothetical protein